MQLHRLIYFSLSALHVSGDVSAHHQEHLTVFTVSSSIHPVCCRLVSWMSWNCVSLNTVKYSWWWAKTSPKTCKADREK